VQVDGKYFYIDRTGAFVGEPSVEHLASSQFSEGLASFKKAGKAGFIDETGAVVVEARFDFARSFAGGRAAVCLANLWGFIDRGGRFVIEPRFHKANDFHEGLALVTEGTRASYIDPDGRVIYSSELPGLTSLGGVPCGQTTVIR
jgi:hypothetical protein